MNADGQGQEHPGLSAFTGDHQRLSNNKQDGTLV
jgi:hypothetical protein